MQLVLLGLVLGLVTRMRTIISASYQRRGPNHPGPTTGWGRRGNSSASIHNSNRSNSSRRRIRRRQRLAERAVVRGRQPQPQYQPQALPILPILPEDDDGSSSSSSDANDDGEDYNGNGRRHTCNGAGNRTPSGRRHAQAQAHPAAETGGATISTDGRKVLSGMKESIVTTGLRRMEQMRNFYRQNSNAGETERADEKLYLWKQLIDELLNAVVFKNIHGI